MTAALYYFVLITINRLDARVGFLVRFTGSPEGKCQARWRTLTDNVCSLKKCKKIDVIYLGASYSDVFFVKSVRVTGEQNRNKPNSVGSARRLEGSVGSEGSFFLLSKCCTSGSTGLGAENMNLQIDLTLNLLCMNSNIPTFRVTVYCFFSDRFLAVYFVEQAQRNIVSGDHDLQPTTKG